MTRVYDPEETRNLIVDTAAKLFIEKGYDKTSINDIIANLGGLSKGAIYYHFKSKEEIMSAVGDKLYAGSNGRVYEIFQDKNYNGFEKLKKIFEASIHSSVQNQVFSTFPDLLKNPKLLVLYLRDTVQKEAPEMINGILEEGIRDGSIKTEYPRELAEVLMLVGDLWLNPMIYPCEPEEMIRKMKFFQHMTQLFGLDVIDQSMIEQMQQYAMIYRDNNKHK